MFASNFSSGSTIPLGSEVLPEENCTNVNPAPLTWVDDVPALVMA